MTTVKGCMPVNDVQIVFQIGKVTCILPKITLEVVLMESCDWGQTKLSKTTYTNPVQQGPVLTTSGHIISTYSAIWINCDAKAGHKVPSQQEVVASILVASQQFL